MRATVLAVALMLALAACGSPESDAGATYRVTYVVDGDSDQADITIQNAGGDTSQFADEPLPWSFSFNAVVGDFVYVSAQRGGAPGDITCSIELDGVTVKSSTSTGEFTICSASGSV